MATHTSITESSIEAGTLLCGNGALHTMLAACTHARTQYSVSYRPSPLASVPTSLPWYTFYRDSQQPFSQCSHSENICLAVRVVCRIVESSLDPPFSSRFSCRKQVQSTSACPSITCRCCFAGRRSRSSEPHALALLKANSAFSFRVGLCVPPPQQEVVRNHSTCSARLRASLRIRSSQCASYGILVWHGLHVPAVAWPGQGTLEGGPVW